MSRRDISFEIEDEIVEMDFGNWVMLMVYAKTLNRNKFLLIDSYNVNKSLDEEYVEFNPDKLKSVIEFVNELIIALKKEQELKKIYNERQLIDLLDNDEDFLFTALFENNNVFLNNDANIQLLKSLKNRILEKSLETNQPHSVFIE